MVNLGDTVSQWVCQELSVEWIWLCFQQKPRILANKELGRMVEKQQQQNYNNLLNLIAGSRLGRGVGKQKEEEQLR